jgi:F-type H+-transporting ATPase subunit b
MHIITHIFHLIIPVAHAADAAAATTAASATPSVTTLLGIDWKLFLAQLVNFVIVLFILWKWAFTPLTKKLAERTSRIDKSLKEADEINKLHAQAEADRLEAIRIARVEASAIISAAEKSANLAKDEIVAEAHKHAKQIAEESKRALASQQTEMMNQVRSDAALLIIAATEKILGEKLNPKTDKELIDRSLEHLKERA